MSSDENKAMVQVVLRRRIIVTEDLVFEAEREVHLPIPPFVGMRLYNAESSPPGCDPSDNPIEEIAYDLETGRLLCYLPIDDFRRESSGCDDWTEEAALKYYRDWKLERDEGVQPSWKSEWN